MRGCLVLVFNYGMYGRWITAPGNKPLIYYTVELRLIFQEFLTNGATKVRPKRSYSFVCYQVYNLYEQFGGTMLIIKVREF